MRKLTNEQRREGERRERMQDEGRNMPKVKPKSKPHQGWPQSKYCKYDYDGNPYPDEFIRQGPGVYSGPGKV